MSALLLLSNIWRILKLFIELIKFSKPILVPAAIFPFLKSNQVQLMTALCSPSGV